MGRNLLVRVRLVGTRYGSYPDAHAILSAIHTQLGAIVGHDETEKLLGEVRVSCLLPVIDDEVYYPVSTQFIPQLQKELEQKPSLKPLINGIKKGTLFARVEGGVYDLKTPVKVKYGKRPRNALDRLTNASNLYFENYWYTDPPTNEFAVILYNWPDKEELDPSVVFRYLHLGGKKSVGAVVVHVSHGEYEGPTLLMERGTLLSLARPSERIPTFPPVADEKWVFRIKSGTKEVMRRSIGVYKHGSYLDNGEYEGGDVPVGDDDRGYVVKLFVRPLFVEVSKCQL